MLFDLQGKRRRVVQATYLGLAILLGGGLVLFGIGGDVSGGGLFDAFRDDGGGGGNGNTLVKKRVEDSEKALRTNPRNEQALKELVRGYYQLAQSEVEPNAIGFPEEAQDELRKAGAAWDRYLALEPKRPDGSLALTAIQIYGVDPGALNKPAKAARAANLVAEAKPSKNAYIRVVQYADLAGNKRLANLAGQEAIDLAPRGKKEQVKQEVEQAKQSKEQLEAQQQAQQGAQQGGAPPPAAPPPGQ